MTTLNYTKSRSIKRFRESVAREDKVAAKIRWLPITKGKYWGLTAPELIIRDASHFSWAMSVPGFFSAAQRHQAEIVAARAAHILPPEGNVPSQGFCFQFNERGYLQAISIAKKPRKGRGAKSGLVWLPHLNLLISQQLQHRGDKYGPLKVAQLVREKLLFEECPNRVICERFFEDDEKFAITCACRHFLPGA